MSDVARAETGEDLALDRAKVLQVAAQPQDRGYLSQILLQIGLSRTDTTVRLDEFREKLVEVEPDLLFIDLDDNQPGAIEVIREIRSGGLGANPGAVIVALTQKPKMSTVKAALKAGVDALILKPVAEESLRGQVVPLLGRRDAAGAPAVDAGDEKCRATLHDLSVQKFFHLANDIRRSAAKLREVLVKHPGRPLPDGALGHVVVALDEIETVVGEQQFGNVLRIVATARRALEEVVEGKRRPTIELLDLLQLQGLSIAAVLREDGALAGDLIAALDKAAGIVGGRGEVLCDDEEGAREEEDAAETPEPSAAAEARPEDGDGFPFRVRLRAWWEGVDPAAVLARRESG